MTDNAIIFTEESLKKHDAELLDKVAEKIKQDWLFRGKDGKPYRDTIDEIIAELKAEEVR